MTGSTRPVGVAQPKAKVPFSQPHFLAPLTFLKAVFQEAEVIVLDAEASQLPKVEGKKYVVFLTGLGIGEFPELHLVATDSQSYEKFTALETLEEKEQNFCALHNTSLPFRRYLEKSALRAYENYIYTLPLTDFSTGLLKAAGAPEALCQKMDSARQALAPLAVFSYTQLQAFALALMDSLKTEKNTLEEFIKGITYDTSNDPATFVEYINMLADQEDLKPLAECKEYCQWTLQYKDFSEAFAILEAAIPELGKKVLDLRDSLGEQQAALEQLCKKAKLPGAILLTDQGQFKVSDVYQGVAAATCPLLKSILTKANKDIEAIILSPHKKALEQHVEKMHTTPACDFVPLAFFRAYHEHLASPTDSKHYIQCKAPIYDNQKEYGLTRRLQVELQDLFQGIKMDAVAEEAKEFDLRAAPSLAKLMETIGNNFKIKFFVETPERPLDHDSYWCPAAQMEGLEYGLRYYSEFEEKTASLNEAKGDQITSLFKLYRQVNCDFLKARPPEVINKFLCMPRTMLEFMTVLNALSELPGLEKDQAFKRRVVEKFLPKFQQDRVKGLYSVVPDKFLAMALEVYKDDSGKLAQVKSIQTEVLDFKKRAVLQCRDELFLLMKKFRAQDMQQLSSRAGVVKWKPPVWLKELYSEKTGTFVAVPLGTKHLGDYLDTITSAADFTLEKYEAFSVQAGAKSGKVLKAEAEVTAGLKLA